MSLAKSARASQIARNVKSGVYVQMRKFANYGSVIEDSIFAQQAEADRKLRQIQAQRAKKVKGFA
tara:strand:- start:327 stop:521 length:195 start_codon:yes stop_codon:yes gene_type:complete